MRIKVMVPEGIDPGQARLGFLRAGIKTVDRGYEISVNRFGDFLFAHWNEIEIPDDLIEEVTVADGS